jgi:hypothetical protein
MQSSTCTPCSFHLPSFLHVSVLSCLPLPLPSPSPCTNLKLTSPIPRRHDDTTTRRASTRLGIEPTVAKLPQPPSRSPFPPPLSHPYPYPVQLSSKSKSRSSSIPALYQPASPVTIITLPAYYTIPYHTLLYPTHRRRAPRVKHQNGHSSQNALSCVTLLGLSAARGVRVWFSFAAALPTPQGRGCVRSRQDRDGVEAEIRRCA